MIKNSLSPLIQKLSPKIGRTAIDGYSPFKGISIDNVHSLHPSTIHRGDFRL